MRRHTSSFAASRRTRNKEILLKSAVLNTNDEIEVFDEKPNPWGRIRIREQQGSQVSDKKKCSIFLPPHQLEEIAQACHAVAAGIKARTATILGAPFDTQPTSADPPPADPGQLWATTLENKQSPHWCRATTFPAELEESEALLIANTLTERLKSSTEIVRLIDKMHRVLDKFRDRRQENEVFANTLTEEEREIIREHRRKAPHHEVVQSTELPPCGSDHDPQPLDRGLILEIIHDLDRRVLQAQADGSPQDRDIERAQSAALRRLLERADTFLG